MSDMNQQEQPWRPLRSQLLDKMERPITQGLFLEVQYGENAIYTLKEVDHEWKGKLYPSLKRLYLECEDPTEYTFANQYLLGWRHWLRLCENKLIRKEIDEWRYELEVKLRSKGVLSVLKKAQAGNLQAAKWAADKGWSEQRVGRPTKEDIEHEKKVRAGITDEFSADAARMASLHQLQ
jgi:hypothetical protein